MKDLKQLIEEGRETDFFSPVLNSIGSEPSEVFSRAHVFGKVWNGVNLVTIIEKRLDELHPYPNNPRINDKAAQAVAKSIAAYGFKVPVVVTPDGEIICGHTRYKAAKILGLDSVPCVIADDLSPEQIKAFRIADNKVSDFSIWDNKLLLDELDGIGDDIFTGFEIGEVFDTVIDEGDTSPVDDNLFGIMYECTFRSESKEKIEEIQSIWDNMQDG